MKLPEAYVKKSSERECSKMGNRDTLLALYPFDVSTGARTGAHPGKTFGPDQVTAFDRRHIFYQAEDISFSGVRELHTRVSAIAEQGTAFLVRAQRGHGGQYLRRTKMRKGACPAGLKHAKLHSFPVDLDKWPNLDNLDPRKAPVGAWLWMLQILGPEFDDVSVSAHWSSSCCVRTPIGTAPATLDARLWFWMDVPLGASAAKDIMKALNRRVRDYFIERGVLMDKRHNLVDPKISEVQQPNYVATPIFEGGLTDPLPLRRALLEGGRDAVCVSNCWAMMTSTTNSEPGVAPQPAKEKKARAPHVARPRLFVPGDVIPLAAAARLIAAQREMLDAALKGTASEEYREACTRVYHRRVALEMAALAIHRGGLEGTGSSDESSTMIAAAYVASLPLDLPVERVRSEVRAILVAVTGAEWVSAEWEGTADGSIIDRYKRASAGEKGKGGRDLRYTYSKKRLLAEWEPTYEEIMVLGLRSLAADADRSASARDAAREERGTPTRDEWLAAARVQAPAVHALRAQGLKVRAIAEQLGLSIGKVLRLLAVLLERDTVAIPVTAMPVTLEQDIVDAASPDLSDDFAYDVQENQLPSIRLVQGSEEEVAEEICHPLQLGKLRLRLAA